MNRNHLVCVTGGSGFIAAHTIRGLLERDYRVRATVRDLSRTAKYSFLNQLDGAGDRLELVEADLLQPGSLREAVDGATTVLHMASPYTINAEDPQRDLVAPALEGTRSVLEACRASESVSRVVLTSSIAALTDEPDSNHVLTEQDWNSTSSLSRNPYHYSKTVAERSAWTFMEEQRPGFSLVVINPFMVIGPSLGPSLNTTNQMIRDFITGVYPGILDINWGFVDVRDVALAHILAMERPEARGRYLCAAENLHMRDVITVLRDGGYGRNYRLPSMDLTGTAATMFVKLLSWTQPKDTGTYMRTHLGRHLRYDNSKIRRELDLSFRDIAPSILETAEDLVRWGHLPAPETSR